MTDGMAGMDGQLSVEFRLGPRLNDWQAQYTGMATYEAAAKKARALYKTLCEQHGQSAGVKVRVCETPFGRLLGEVNRAGQCVYRGASP